MPPTPDVIVVGLGAMGGAALRALARRGHRTLGLDRFSPPHARGSSHSGGCVIREACHEHPDYVPIARRAYLLWEELERDADCRLLTVTGGLMIGLPDGPLVSGSLESARRHSVAHERLDAKEIRRRFPALQPADGMVGVWDPRAGLLRPEAAVAAFLDAARRHGAAVRFDEPALAWRADGDGVVVTTRRGTYRAARLVLAAGAGLPRLVSGLPLRVERQVEFWFETVGFRGAHDSDRCPISIWEHDPGRLLVALPRSEHGVKVTRLDSGAEIDPDHVDKEASSSEIAAVRELLQRHLPFASGPIIRSAARPATRTRDGHFILDEHPLHRQAMVVSACSGLGFQFAPVVGEVIADLLVEGWTRHDLGLFRLSRFAAAAQSAAARAAVASSPAPERR